MTIRFEYKCNQCGHNYLEQRNDDELIPYITKCNACEDGNYEETKQTVLSE